MSMEEIIEKKMEEVTQGTEPAEEQEETIERPFTLRKLKDADLFPFMLFEPWLSLSLSYLPPLNLFIYCI